MLGFFSIISRYFGVHRLLFGVITMFYELIKVICFITPCLRQGVSIQYFSARRNFLKKVTALFIVAHEQQHFFGWNFSFLTA